MAIELDDMEKRFLAERAAGLLDSDMSPELCERCRNNLTRSELEYAQQIDIYLCVDCGYLLLK